MGISSPSPQELMDNSIAFGVPSFLFFIMRLLNSGWVLKKFHFEDGLMCVAFFFYVSLLVFINVTATYTTNLYPPEDEAAILADPADVQARILGSKLVIPLEQSMLLSTWLVKTCIWLFLRRLCRQLPKFQFALTCLIIYIWVGYAVIQICYYAVFCRPFDQYWAVPVSNQQCATYAHYCQVQMVFNISSDAALIVIPLLMFLIARLPLKRKVILMAVFSMAGFTIIAAILNKVYNFLSPMTTTYQLWYIREASVAIQVGNLICCWQLMQKLFRLRSFDNKSDQIVVQPEMTGRHHLEHPSQYSVCGSPKNDSWFKKQRGRMAHLGQLSSWVFATGDKKTGDGVFKTQKEKDMRTTQTSTMTDRTYATSRGNGVNASVAQSYMVTIKRDGDDADPTIEYRNKDDIV